MQQTISTLTRCRASALASSSKVTLPLFPHAQKRWVSWSKKGDDKKKKKINRDSKRLGVFKPLPTNQLSHPLFQPGESEGLGLPVLKHDVLTEEAALNKAMRFSNEKNSPITIYGVPRNLLIEYRLLTTPCSVVRDITLSTAEKLDTAGQQSSRDSRMVFTGPAGCGKSVALLQSVEYCISAGWITLYIPRAHTLINSSTTYHYDSHSRTYHQPAFSYQLLQRFLTVNSDALAALKTANNIVVERGLSLAAGSSFVDLINIGLKDKSHSPFVLSALLSEIAGQDKYPVLLAVDDIQALYRPTSLYRNPRFEGIKPYHLSVPRLLLEYASGKKAFARGAVLGAVSLANTNFAPQLELCEGLGIQYGEPSGPYVKRSAELIEYAKGLQNLPVPAQMSVEEAATLYEVWTKDKALHTDESDETFLSKYSEASGNPREFVWKGLLSTLST